MLKNNYVSLISILTGLLINFNVQSTELPDQSDDFSNKNVHSGSENTVSDNNLSNNNLTTPANNNNPISNNQLPINEGIQVNTSEPQNAQNFNHNQKSANDFSTNNSMNDKTIDISNDINTYPTNDEMITSTNKNNRKTSNVSPSPMAGTESNKVSKQPPQKK